MRRILAFWLVTATLIAGIVWACLLLSQNRASSNEAYERAEQLLSTWTIFAAKISLPQDSLVFSAEEAVAKMNERAKRVFPNQKVSFVLWHPGDAALPGYTLNPAPVDWTDSDRRLDALRQAPERWLKRSEQEVPGPHPETLETETAASSAPPATWVNSLAEQTTRYLEDYGYKARFLDGHVYFFRKDAFLPRIISKQLYFLDKASWSTVFAVPPGSSSASPIDIRPFVEGSGVDFEPGASAQYTPATGIAALHLPEESWPTADAVFSTGCGEPLGAPSEAGRLWMRLKYRYADTVYRTKTWFGIP